MPFDPTWRRIRRLTHWTHRQEHILRRLCNGTPLPIIAEDLDLPLERVCKEMRRAQQRARDTRPWLRPPTPGEEAHDLERHEAENSHLRAMGAEEREYTPVLRNIDTDILHDAMRLLQACMNLEMQKRPASSGPRMPVPSQVPTAESLRSEWLECMLGSDTKPMAGRALPAPLLMEKLMHAAGRQNAAEGKRT